MLSQNIIYYGSDTPLPERRHLHAGPLSMSFEEGGLRYIKLGEREIVRRIYVAVRDYQWRTAPSVISNLQLETTDSSFSISYEVTNQLDNVDFAWSGKITGDSSGKIAFTMNGEARSTFRRNRVGFCVLHPASCAGLSCRVEHENGTIDESQFPLEVAPQPMINGRIAPYQPFVDMRAIRYPAVPDATVDIRFAGDLFEMEDQRNWIDASYKTYCTPLRLPIPTEVPKGTKISQSVTLTLQGVPADIPVITTPASVHFVLDDTATQVPLPPIGLGTASHEQPLSPTEIERLQRLALAHLRVDLQLSQSDYPLKLRQAARDAHALGIPLEIALLLSDNAEFELESLAQLLPEIQPQVSSWLIFHEVTGTSPESYIRLAHQYVASYDTSAKFGAGSNANFTELNRQRPATALVDFITFAANPQVHAFDNTSIAETCEMFALTIQTGRQFADGKPLAVSPITLKARFNAAANEKDEPDPNKLPPQVDPRQMSLFAAGWTLGSLKYLVESGPLKHISCYETTGWCGIMETETGPPLPNLFPSLPGCVFPIYHILADIAEYTGGNVTAIRSSNPLCVVGMLLKKEGRAQLLLANLTDTPQQVTIPHLGDQPHLWLLDETNAESAMREPEAYRAKPGTPLANSELTMRPYGIARIDVTLL